MACSFTAAPDGTGTLTMGSKLDDELNGDMATVINDMAAPVGQTVEGWVMSTLARVDAFMSGLHVFDGPGVLDASGLQKAESAANDLSENVGVPVYVDISIGGDDPATAASLTPGTSAAGTTAFSSSPWPCRAVASAGKSTRLGP